MQINTNFSNISTHLLRRELGFSLPNPLPGILARNLQACQKEKNASQKESTLYKNLVAVCVQNNMACTLNKKGSLQLHDLISHKPLWKVKTNQRLNHSWIRIEEGNIVFTGYSDHNQHMSCLYIHDVETGTLKKKLSLAEEASYKDIGIQSKSLYIYNKYSLYPKITECLIDQDVKPSTFYEDKSNEYGISAISKDYMVKIAAKSLTATIFDIATKSTRKIPLPIDKTPHLAKCFIVDHSCICIGIENGFPQLIKIDLQNKSISTYLPHDGDKTHPDVCSTLFCHKEYIYIGTVSGTLIVVNLEKKEHTIFENRHPHALASIKADDYLVVTIGENGTEVKISDAPTIESTVTKNISSRVEPIRLDQGKVWLLSEGNLIEQDFAAPVENPKEEKID